MEEKGTSQEWGFLNFLRPLMTAGLPLMKNVLTQLAKNVLLPFGLSAWVSATDTAIQKNSWIRKYSINNFKWRNGIYNGSS